jgi:hypothetical protein
MRPPGQRVSPTAAGPPRRGRWGGGSPGMRHSCGRWARTSRFHACRRGGNPWAGPVHGTMTGLKRAFFLSFFHEERQRGGVCSHHGGGGGGRDADTGALGGGSAERRGGGRQQGVIAGGAAQAAACGTYQAGSQQERAGGGWGRKERKIYARCQAWLRVGYEPTTPRWNTECSTFEATGPAGVGARTELGGAGAGARTELGGEEEGNLAGKGM